MAWTFTLDLEDHGPGEDGLDRHGGHQLGSVASDLAHHEDRADDRPLLEEAEDLSHVGSSGCSKRASTSSASI
jgi:hypothetical protein